MEPNGTGMGLFRIGQPVLLCLLRLLGRGLSVTALNGRYRVESSVECAGETRCLPRHSEKPRETMQVRPGNVSTPPHIFSEVEQETIMISRKIARHLPAGALLGSLLLGAVAAVAFGTPAPQSGAQKEQLGILRAPEIDAGFHLLYQQKPAEAREQFAAWKKLHPEDPLGDAAEAASYLFEECYRQGVLTSEFFLDDKRFLGKDALTPDPALRAAFFAAVRRAQDLAERRLKENPEDAGALFAMTLSVGLEADYTSLIDMRQLESLGKIREADEYAKRLLAVAPEAADAYLTLGVANYIIGSLPGHKRFFLRFVGIRGDRKGGIRQLETAAADGRYLRPFAKILLALVALREEQPELARVQLKELVAEFPQNVMFARELAKLEGGGRR